MGAQFESKFTAPHGLEKSSWVSEAYCRMFTGSRNVFNCSSGHRRAGRSALYPGSILLALCDDGVIHVINSESRTIHNSMNSLLKERFKAVGMLHPVGLMIKIIVWSRGNGARIYNCANGSMMYEFDSFKGHGQIKSRMATSIAPMS